MPQPSFSINGKPVTVDAPDDMPLLWCCVTCSETPDPSRHVDNIDTIL